MKTPIPTRLMTTEELLAIPEDGMDRWLLCGQLRERPMTLRDRRNSRVLVTIGYRLTTWSAHQPEPRGAVLAGNAGFRIRRSPDTVVGLDVAYIGPELASQESQDIPLVDGVPVLAVEILSPSNTQQDIDEKVDTYRAAGVALIWVVDPHDQTILVYRPGAMPEFFNVHQELSGEPELPGFRVPVGQIFAR